MKRMVWSTVCSSALLITTHLQAGESQHEYSNGGRQFNINPGNMMNGMGNPLRNMFGGSNRYNDGYNNYRYAPPPPPGYGYPGSPYPPPVNYGYSGETPNSRYTAPPQVGSQPQMPATTPAQSQPATSSNYNSRSNHPQSPVDTTTFQPTYQKSYRFRPLDATSIREEETPVTGAPNKEATQTVKSEEPQRSSTPVTQRPLAPPSYPFSETRETEQTSLRYRKQSTQTTNFPQAGTQPIDQENQMMRFRPLDKPGISN